MKRNELAFDVRKRGSDEHGNVWLDTLGKSPKQSDKAMTNRTGTPVTKQESAR